MTGAGAGALAGACTDGRAGGGRGAALSCRSKGVWLPGDSADSSGIPDPSNSATSCSCAPCLLLAGFPLEEEGESCFGGKLQLISLWGEAASGAKLGFLLTVRVTGVWSRGTGSTKALIAGLRVWHRGVAPLLYGRGDPTLQGAGAPMLETGFAPMPHALVVTAPGCTRRQGRLRGIMAPPRVAIGRRAGGAEEFLQSSGGMFVLLRRLLLPAVVRRGRTSLISGFGSPAEQAHKRPCINKLIYSTYTVIRTSNMGEATSWDTKVR